MPQTTGLFSICQLNPLLTSLHHYLLFTHSIFLFSPPSLMCQLNPPLFHLFPALLSICVNPFPPLAPSPPHLIHHHPSHLHLVCSLLLSTCFHFLNCSRSIKFTLPSMAIFHFLFHSLLRHTAWLHLTPVLSALYGVLYSARPTWPQVGIAVLVMAVDWAEAAGYSVLQETDTMG